MRGKALLLGSVSSIATIAVAVSAAQAQTVTPGANGYTFSVQGGALFSAPDTELSQKAGEISSGSGSTAITSLKDLPTDIGYNAAFTLGKKLDGNWDMAFGASMNRLLENSGSFNFSTTSGSGSGSTNGLVGESTNFSFETADFEVGYHPMVDNGLDVRLFGGIRGLHSNNGREDTYFATTSGASSSLQSLDKTGQSDFLGAGPRIGISAAKRFDGSSFGISGSLAGAAIFGHQTDTFGGVVSASGSGSGSPFVVPLASGATGTKLVTDVDASLGIDYYFNEAAALTIGYHAENLTNIAPLNPSTFNLPQASSRLVQGPFLKFTGSF